MNGIYSEEKTIELSFCGPDARFGLVGALDMFMNIAEDHEEAAGFGIKKMCAMDRYWIIGRTRVEFVKRPEIMDKVTLSTWFDKPKHLYVNREYLMDSEGEILVKGETEWLVAVGGCKKLVSVADYISADASCARGPLFDGEMVKVNKEFLPEEKIGTYVVKASDTDFIGHMNNVSYMRALAGFLTREEICSASKAELFYSMQCCEGDELSVYKRKIDGGAEYGLFLPEDKNAFTARIISS